MSPLLAASMMRRRMRCTGSGNCEGSRRIVTGFDSSSAEEPPGVSVCKGMRWTFSPATSSSIGGFRSSFSARAGDVVPASTTRQSAGSQEFAKHLSIGAARLLDVENPATIAALEDGSMMCAQGVELARHNPVAQIVDQGEQFFLTVELAEFAQRCGEGRLGHDFGLDACHLRLCPSFVLILGRAQAHIFLNLGLQISNRHEHLSPSFACTSAWHRCVIQLSNRKA